MAYGLHIYKKRGKIVCVKDIRIEVVEPSLMGGGGAGSA